MPANEFADENSIHPGLSIIHANHMEDLRRVAIEWVCRHPLCPLENEIFLVQSNGMAQWLKLALAADDGCGISAAVEMQLPARFLWNAYRAVLGEERVPDLSPYEKGQLTWRLFRLLPTLVEEAWFAPLKRYLEIDGDLRKRYQLAFQLADLYDQYQVYRADWLRDWRAGRHRIRNAWGNDEALPVDQQWQASLWRCICEDIPVFQREAGRFQLHRLFTQSVKSITSRPSGLPRRLIVFGISSLPAQTLDAIHAISRVVQVLVFAHNPCRHYWVDIIEDRDLIRAHDTRHRRKRTDTDYFRPEQLHQQVNPLLAAWAKQARDYVGLLYGYDKPEEYRNQFGEIDLFRDTTVTGKSASLLAQVQQAILDLTPLPRSADLKIPVRSPEKSITFVSVHSRQREVEVLQDQLLSFFEEHPSLKPQDVIVMTPEIETYSPHINAVFGRLPEKDERHIPFTISDSTSPEGVSIFQAVETLLTLPNARVTASDLMGLLSVPSICRRFGFTKADLPLIQTWIEGSGIRWGLNGRHRKSLNLPSGFEQNSWRFGFQRMLLGYAVGESEPWKGIEPYGEIGGLDAALLGQLSFMIEKMEDHWNRLCRWFSPEGWVREISALINDFFLPMENTESLFLTLLADTLDHWLDDCSQADLAETLPLSVVREVLLKTVLQTSVSHRFLTGRVTFCTMMPMRAIPFKIVVLLGMNDGEYPRSTQPLDFDLMALPGQYRPGDRSRREDDRYLFLEALLSARKRLYISYIGHSIQDNSERMPSVLVSQLRDYLDAGWQIASPQTSHQTSAQTLFEQLTVEHPLQPFSRTYFQPEKWPARFTYANEWEDVFHRPEKPAEERALAAAKTEKSIPFHPLIQFLKNPIRAFFNQRLNVVFPPVDTAIENQEPFSLDSLAMFGPGMQLLEAGIAAEKSNREDALAAAATQLRRSGALPLFGFGRLSIEELADPIRCMLEYRDDLIKYWPEEKTVFEIQFWAGLERASCETVEDWLDDLRMRTASDPYGKERPEYARWDYYPGAIMDKKGRMYRFYPLVGPWVKHLAASSQGLELTTYLIAPDGISQIRPLDTATAKQRMNEILYYHSLGLRRPLPITARVALAYFYAHATADPEDAEKIAKDAARSVYEGNGFSHSGELGYGDGVYLRRCYPTFDALWNSGINQFKELVTKLYAPIIGATTG